MIESGSNVRPVLQLGGVGRDQDLFADGPLVPALGLAEVVVDLGNPEDEAALGVLVLVDQAEGMAELVEDEPADLAGVGQHVGR